MPLKRIAKYSLITAACAVCILIAVYAYFFYVYMPAHFQQEVLPELMKNAGISGFSGKVKSAGAFGANLGELCIGDPENPTLKVHSVIIKYRFRNIFMPRQPDITSIEFKGLELVCRLQNKNFEINNIDLAKFIAQLKEHFSGRHQHAVGSWGNTRLSITDGLMRLNWNGTKLLLPFELHFNPGSQNWESFCVDLKYTWREHPVNAELTVDMRKQQVEISLNARSEMRKLLTLLKKSGRFEVPHGLRLSGLLQLTGKIDFEFSPWKFRKITLSGSSRDCQADYGGLQLGNRKRPSGLKMPVTISIDSAGDAHIWKLENAMLTKPSPFIIRSLSCLVPADNRKALEFAGEFEFRFSQLGLLKYYRLKDLRSDNPVRRLAGSYNRISGNWQLKTAAEGPHARHDAIKAVMTCGNSKIFAEIDDLRISGNGNARNGALELTTLIRDFSAVGRQNAYFAKQAKLDSILELVFAPGKKLHIKKNTFKLTLPEFSVSSPVRQLEARDLSIAGSNSFTGFNMNSFALSATAAGIGIRQDGENLTGRNNKLKLDGILHKDKNTWETALSVTAENISGQYRNCGFTLHNVHSNNFITLKAPISLCKQQNIDNCNLRLQCGRGELASGNNWLKLSGFDVGAALTFAADGALQHRTFSGKIRNSELKYQSAHASASEVELMGKYEPGTAKAAAGEKENQDFLARLEAAALTVRHGNMLYSAKLPQFNLSGKSGSNTAGSFIPETVRIAGETVDFQLARGQELIKVSELNLNADTVFSNTAESFKAGLQNLRLELNSEKISGIWSGINICSAKTGLEAAADINCKTDRVGLNRIRGALAAEKLIAYGKSWKLGSGKLKSNVSGELLDTELNLELKPEIRCYDFYAASHDAALNVPEVSIKAEVENGKATGSLFFNQATFCKNGLALSCAGISIFLPFGTGAAEGRMEAKQLKLNNRELGKVDAKLQYHDGNILIRASHFSQILDNASLFFSGKLKLASFPGWEGDFTVPEFKVKNPLSVSELFPALKNIGVAGKTALEGHLEGDLQNCRASGSVAINNGTLYFADWELSGASGKCAFSDLFGLESNTRQKLYCRQLKNDSIELADVQMEFEPHGLDKLLVDRLAAKWFGGSLTSLNSFTLEKACSVPDKINFLASAITLSPFLEYSGIKGFITDAVVSGIIPFSIRKGKVYISGAALATQASEMGALRLENDLTEYGGGTVEDKAAASQREFAMAALKHFNYNWIRLNVNISEDNTEISLNLDGYPAKTLPFRYDEQKKAFVPAAPDEPGITGDMTIETNFKIPVKSTSEDSK
ncbi:MAG: YdbH domain-containing protein [Victivallales bacterium]|nr:YdbH domain-containing protein [Victivallales bacterium]